MNSRYTDAYWNQREAFLRQKALERMAEEKFTTPEMQQAWIEAVQHYRTDRSSWYRPPVPKQSLKQRIKKLIRRKHG